VLLCLKSSVAFVVASTGAWLALFQEIAKLLPLSTKVTKAGSLQPGKGQDKSTFLASVRNAALAPLWSVSRHSCLLAMCIPSEPFEGLGGT
jgi:hypothetical protein